jgi:hypothetical protein
MEQVNHTRCLCSVTASCASRSAPATSSDPAAEGSMHVPQAPPSAASVPQATSYVLHTKHKRVKYQPTHDVMVICVLAGPLSSTQRELWAVLTQKQLPNTLAAANTAESGLNSETSTLMRNLMAQSGGNRTQLTIANAVWTNKTSVLKPYSDSMLKLFQASRNLHRSGNHQQQTDAQPCNIWPHPCSMWQQHQHYHCVVDMPCTAAATCAVCRQLSPSCHSRWCSAGTCHCCQDCCIYGRRSSKATHVQVSVMLLLHLPSSIFWHS